MYVDLLSLIEMTYNNSQKTQTNNFGRLKKRARELEISIEDKLQAYQKIDSSLNINVLATDEEAPLDFSEAREISKAIETLLLEFGDVLHDMGRVATQSKSVSSSAYIQRCREILNDDRHYFRKIQRSITKKEESSELFRERNTARDKELSDTELLLKEREHLNNSSRMVDDIYNRALGTKDQLQHQRRVFLAGDSRMSKMLSSFPGMSQIMNSIQRKKIRDQRILAVVIGALLFFVIWWYLL